MICSATGVDSSLRAVPRSAHWLLFVLLGLTVAYAQTVDAEIENQQRQLRDIQQRLDEARRDDSLLALREQAGLARLDALDRRITLTRRYLNELRAQIAARTTDIAQTAARIRSTEEEVSRLRQTVARRLVRLYKYGRLFPLEAILATRSLPEVYRRSLYLRWISRADAASIERLRTLNGELITQRARLLAAYEELDRLQNEQLTQERNLLTARAAETTAIKSIRSQKAAKRALSEELTAASQRIQALIAELMARRARESGTGGLEALKGKLPWPVKGSVIAGFGSQVHPRYKTRTNNLGIDIKTDSSSPVFAVAPGRVAYADRFLGYGNLVIIDHGDACYTLYGNLAEIAVSVDQSVTPSTILGRAADYLHFELRKEGRPLDPAPWLKNAP